jgi:exopolysaccharide biosynthesis protein
MSLIKRCFGFLLALTFFLTSTGAASAQIKPLPIDDNPGYPPLEKGYLSDMEYEDPSIHVAIETGREFNTNYWLARITIKDPSQLRTVSANGFDSTRTMSGRALANRVNAVFAINGDYFSYRNDGFLIRQGKQYRDLPSGKRDVMMLDEKGDMHIVRRATAEALAPYIEKNIINSFNFGPALVVDGERMGGFVDNDDAALLGRQRMGLAQVKKGELNYIALACTGPKWGNSGWTLDQFSQMMERLGVENAYNLDGGNSTMLMFQGGYVNRINEETMRTISDIIYFASAWPEE